tara:strand:- start:1014 stop:2084 length:1071 start_codon:yes stop_codon:yes gene_type:complete
MAFFINLDKAPLKGIVEAMDAGANLVYKTFDVLLRYTEIIGKESPDDGSSLYYSLDWLKYKDRPYDFKWFKNKRIKYSTGVLSVPQGGDVPDYLYIHINGLGKSVNSHGFMLRSLFESGDDPHVVIVDLFKNGISDLTKERTSGRMLLRQIKSVIDHYSDAHGPDVKVIISGEGTGATLAAAFMCEFSNNYSNIHGVILQNLFMYRNSKDLYSTVLEVLAVSSGISRFPLPLFKNKYDVLPDVHGKYLLDPYSVHNIYLDDILVFSGELEKVFSFIFGWHPDVPILMLQSANQLDSSEQDAEIFFKKLPRQQENRFISYSGVESDLNMSHPNIRNQMFADVLDWVGNITLDEGEGQ